MRTNKSETKTMPPPIVNESDSVKPSEESDDLVSQSDDSRGIPPKTFAVGNKVIISSDSVIDIFRRTPWSTYLFFILIAIIMSSSISIDFSF